MAVSWSASGADPQLWAYGPRRRFDVSASARFPMVSRGRLARQIRQDLWRALQRVRGFSPVVELRHAEQGRALLVRAGGQVDGAFPRAWAAARLAELLAEPSLRRRWIAYAGGGASAAPGQAGGGSA